MTRFYCIVLIGLLLFTGSDLIGQERSGGVKRSRKAVFLIIDGVPADVIEKLNTPTIAALSKAGGYTRAYVGGRKTTYNETPTISAPGYNSLLTGTWANKHNVWDNDIAAPNYHYWNIFRIAEKADPNLQTAVFSTWLDNRTKLIGEGLERAGAVMLDHKFDGLEHDLKKYPHDNESGHIRRIDADVVQEAVRYITTHGPDLSWIYLEYTDDMGHQYGDSPQFYEAIENADKQFKAIWDATKLREQNFAEDWLFVITTDHGRNAETGKGHGGQSPRERATWIATNSQQLNGRFNQSPAIVDVLPSILNHLNVTLPDELSKEIDGVPFIGAIDLADLSAEKNGQIITLQWKNFSENKTDKAEIFMAETNWFKDGKTDVYKKVGDTGLLQEKFVFKVESESPFLKILVKGPHHYANVWIVQQKR